MKKRNNSEMDYRSRVGAGGGSPQGRDVRKMPKPVKEFLRQWAIENIADGNESYFIDAPKNNGRWSPKKFEPIITLLWEMFPEWAIYYFTGREDRSAYLVMQRHHKMYYHNDGKTRGRGKSREHPDYHK